MKTYRRFIKLGTKLHASPEFSRKKDADDWYHEMRRKKQFLKDGISIRDDKDGFVFIDYARVWINRRKQNHGPATWTSDEQRLRTYIFPFFSELPIASITPSQVRNLLLKISEPGFLKEGAPAIAPATRDRVKALLSAIFSDAFNEDPPLVPFNPVRGVKIKGQRTGQKKPRFLPDKEVGAKFLEDAQEIGWLEFVVSCIFLMTGVRKQELIALRWKSFDPKEKFLHVTEKYIQVTHTIVPGTKKGTNVSRSIPIPLNLISVLKEHKKRSKFTAPDDFIICKENGRHFNARQISYMIEDIRNKTKVDVSAHGLRHTYGRDFVAETHDTDALKTILGHSSLSTTALYSELSGNRIKPFSESVSYKVVVKRSNVRHKGDTLKNGESEND